MSRGKQCLPLCRLSLNLVSYHREVASIPLGEVSRESCSVSTWGDELHLFTQSSETGLGQATDSTALLSGIR